MRPPSIIEIILILVIIFIIFGAGKLPQLFEYIGKGVQSLRGKKKSNEEIEEVRTTKKGKKKAAKG